MADRRDPGRRPGFPDALLKPFKRLGISASQLAMQRQPGLVAAQQVMDMEVDPDATSGDGMFDR